MKIRDLDLDQYVIVYDMGKSENNEGMTVVGRVIELEFREDDDNMATIDSMGSEYEITDDNYFDLWPKYIEDKTEHIGKRQSNDVQQRKRNDTVNHPSHYNYGDIETIEFIEQVTKHYNPNVAYHIGNAIKYLARSPHKNGKEDVAKAKWYIERAFENWDK